MWHWGTNTEVSKKQNKDASSLPVGTFLQDRRCPLWCPSHPWGLGWGSCWWTLTLTDWKMSRESPQWSSARSTEISLLKLPNFIKQPLNNLRRVLWADEPSSNPHVCGIKHVPHTSACESPQIHDDKALVWSHYVPGMNISDFALSYFAFCFGFTALASHFLPLTFAVWFFCWILAPGRQFKGF